MKFVDRRSLAGLLALAITVAPARLLAAPPPSSDPQAPAPAAPSPDAPPSAPAAAAPADVAAPALVPGIQPLAAPADASAPPAPPPADAVPPPPSPPAEAPTHLAPYVAGGLAIAAAGAGIAFGVLALNAKNDFQNHPTLSSADSGNNYAAYCDASLGGAVVLAAASVVFFLVERNAPQDPGAPVPPQARAAKKSLVSFSAAPTISSHGAGAGAVLHF